MPTKRRSGDDLDDPDREDEDRLERKQEYGQQKEEERRPFVLNRDLHVRDQSHKKGDTLHLTKEEYDALAPMGVFEGGEQPSYEERTEKLQQHRDELAEAQKKRIEEGPETPEGEDEPPEESAQARADRERREQTDPNAPLRPPVPTPPKQA